MKIIKIIVDKMPEMCTACFYCEFSNIGKRRVYWCEGIDINENNISDPTQIPSWCPLEVKDGDK